MTTPNHDLSQLRIDRDRPSGASKRALAMVGGLASISAVFVAAAVWWIRRGGAVQVQVARAELVGGEIGGVGITANGYVVARTKASVSSRISGRLTYLGVSEGSVVKAGDLMARLENADYQAVVAQTEAELLRAGAALLNVIAGLDTTEHGSVVVDGQDITAMSSRQLATWRGRHIGFVFQFYNLLPVLTAYQNIELPLLLTNLSKRERKEHVMTALNVVNLTDRAEHFPRQLAGGQQQRVGIARAIVSDPTIILADEPTGDLDAKSAEEILELLRRLNEEFGKTIIMVTHDANAAERAHAVMNLDKGVLSR